MQEVAADVLGEQSPKRLYMVGGGGWAGEFITHYKTNKMYRNGAFIKGVSPM